MRSRRATAVAALLALGAALAVVAGAYATPNRAAAPAVQSASDAALVEPLVGHRWSGYDVRFPAHRRHLAHGYRTIESETLSVACRPHTSFASGMGLEEESRGAFNGHS